MNFAAFAIWFLEFCLESFGAVRSFRKYPVLFALLAFSAAADMLTFLIGMFMGRTAYICAYWVQKGGKYLLLTVLACYICGKLLNESARLKTAIVSGLVAFLGGLAIVATSGEGYDFADKLLDADITANMLLGLFIAFAWIGRKTRLDKPWGLVASGLLSLLWCDGILAYATKFNTHALKYFWIGELASLIIWNVAAMKKEPEKFSLAVPLGHRVVPSDSVRTIQ